jgi:DNA (cytosine-5)-methyltransferase 1
MNMTIGHDGRKLIMDSFAGGGGASTGIEMALGRSPDIAINHNAAALALHTVNHPGTLHLSENVYKVDPLDYLRRKHIGLAWFSPDCKHFSKAKGGKPVERNIRDLCWIIPGWVERIQKSGGKVDVIIMENVEEFKDYGPLIQTDKGLMPDPNRKGETFKNWCKKLRKLGGKIEHRELRACDYGAPTIRKRLFVIVRFDGKPIMWPIATHGKPTMDVIAGKKLPWRTAAECIDWSLPCPSIFDDAEMIFSRHGLRAVRPLADATMSRVARGMKRYVLDAKEPFLVSLKGSDRRARAASTPHPTVLAGGGHSTVVSPSIQRFNTGATGSAIDEPVPTITANSFIKRPGGAAPLGLLAPVIAAAQHGGSVRSIEDPHHTVTASKKDQNTVAVAFMAQHNGDPRKDGQEASRPGRSADEPLATVTSSGAQQQSVVALLAQNNYQEPGHDAREPMSTIVAKGSTQSPVTAFVSRQFGASVGHGADEPSATVTAGVNKSALVAPYLQAYYGTGDGGEENQPARTITTKDRHGHVEASLAAPPFTADQADRAREVADFMRSHGFWDDREFVTLDIAGDTYVIVDIGMRMLTPRELYNAQGFPSDYKIDADKDGNPFTKSVQVSCVGNSVSPPVAAALVAANCGELAFANDNIVQEVHLAAA